MVVGNTDILVIVPAKGRHQPEQTVEVQSKILYTSYTCVLSYACVHDMTLASVHTEMRKMQP